MQNRPPCKILQFKYWLKVTVFEIVIEQSWIQIPSRTSVLPKPQMLYFKINIYFSSDKTHSISLFCIACNQRVSGFILCEKYIPEAYFTIIVLMRFIPI